MKKIAFFVLLSMACTVANASAETSSLNVTFTPSKASAPVTLLSCEQSDPNHLTLRIGNRAMHTLTMVNYRVEAYDVQGSQLLDYPQPQSEMLNPGRIGAFTVGYTPQPKQAAAVCSITGAQFDGAAFWTSGKPWPERLIEAKPFAVGKQKLQTTPMRYATASKQNAPATKPPALAVTVDGAWVSRTPYGQSYLSVKVDLVAREPVTTSAADFHALLPLNGGGSQDLTALQSATPIVSKNATPQFGGLSLPLSTPGPIVAKDQDLGGMGRIVIVPNNDGKPVSETITFVLTGPTNDMNGTKPVIVWKPTGQ
jgi:hypothetical protein